MKSSLFDALHLAPLEGSEAEAEQLQSWQAHAMEKMKTIISVRLTRRQKEVIMLYYYEGLSEKEIAKQLGITVSCVSHLKRRACAKLEYDLNLIRR